MDAVTKRLRRQLQMSSMHARQRNKNAATMLHRRLTAIERREQQNARALARSRYAVMRELDEYAKTAGSEDATELPQLSNGVKEGSRTCNGQRSLGQCRLELARERASSGRRSTDDPLIYDPSVRGHKGSQNGDTVKPKSPSPGTEYSKQHGPDSSRGEYAQQTSVRDSARSTMSSTTSCIDKQSSFSQVDPKIISLDLTPALLNGQQTKDDTAPLSCRFSAFSVKCQCRYFPCTRPKTYHKLGVDKAYDYQHRFSLAEDGPVTITWSENGIEVDRIKDKSTSNGRTSVLLFSQQQKPDFSPSSPKDRNSARPRTSSAKVTEGEGRDEGHISPRTSIPERLRGLKQLVRELREKNEKKRPRDWATNYGDPVSRRLLRKPAIPVSDQAL